MSAASDAVPRPSRRQRLLRALDRRFAFHPRGNVIAAGLAVALLGGLLSLLLGQDANWDLRNYHLYNGYAALHGRLGVDLAPAQLQSYFNPLLDVLHYALMSGLPAPLAGFALGALHASPERPALAEEFLRGREFSFETITIDGQVRFESATRYYPAPLEVMETPWIQWVVVLPRSIDGPDYADAFEATYGELAKRYQTALVPFLLEDFADKPDFFQPDRIHPTEAAQPLMAERVWKALQPLLK
jgi:hypothetical protein